MANRTAKIIISVLMLASLLTLMLAAAGVLGEAWPSGKNLKTIPGQSKTSTLPVISGTTAQNPQSLEINCVDPEPIPALGMRRWPAKSCLPVIHQADLSSLVGRSAQKAPLAGITVILDPGHGGQDGGASFPTGSANPLISEKEITLDVSLKIKEILLGLGAQVILTREQDAWKSLYSRIAETSRQVLGMFCQELPYRGFSTSAVDYLRPLLDKMITINSDTVESGGRGIMQGIGATADARLLFDIQAQYPDILLISLHCNALSDGSQAGGLQVYYQTNASNYENETSYVRYQDSRSHAPSYMRYDDAGRLNLATKLRDGILKQIPDLKYQGKADILTGDYAILREINLVSALVEMGFVTSPADREILKDAVCRQKIAQGVADAVYAYYCQPDA